MIKPFFFQLFFSCGLDLEIKELQIQLFKKKSTHVCLKRMERTLLGYFSQLYVWV